MDQELHAYFAHAVKAYRDAYARLKAIPDLGMEESRDATGRTIDLASFAVIELNDAKDRLTELVLAYTAPPSDRWVRQGLDTDFEKTGPPRMVIFEGNAYVAICDDTDWCLIEDGHAPKIARRELQVMPVGMIRNLDAEMARV
jgi:hypothetical protein